METRADPEAALTPEQVLLFRHNGFLKLPVRLPEAQVEALKATIWRDLREEVAPVVRDRQGRGGRISHLWGPGGALPAAPPRPQGLEALAGPPRPDTRVLPNPH